MAEVSTPGTHTVEEVAEFLDVNTFQVVKTLLYAADGEPVAALVRGDRELNEVKLKNALGCADLRLAEPEQVVAWTGAPVGFAGPVGLNVPRILADTELRTSTDYVAGANKADTHVRHLCLNRDVQAKIEYRDLRTITEKDPCPRCGGALTLPRGIEVGHVFKLGTKYSEALGARYLDENGKEQTIIMGCYGIGVSRVVAACIEQNHDDAGNVFPPPVAPYEAVVVCLDPKDEAIMHKAEEVAAILRRAGADVLLDDRDERPGVKFKDADLIGFPVQVVVGGKGLARGIVECKDRRTGEKSELALSDLERALVLWRKQVWCGWGLIEDDEDPLECR